jgi:hypothetical protein
VDEGKEEDHRMVRRGIAGRRRIVALALACAMTPVLGNAHVSGGLANGYSDNFNYEATPSELDPGPWQASPNAENVWVVDTVASAGLGQATSIKALRQKTTGSIPNEPIAFVRNGNWENMIVEVRAAFEGVSQDSGVGLVFRSPVDPVLNTPDRNNFYLFTSVVTAASNREGGFATGKGFGLYKRVGGQYYQAAKADTNLALQSSNAGTAAEAHTYKVIIATSADTERARILCYVDGIIVIDTIDTPGDDGGRLPGPMFASGTVGLRTARTKAWFDDFIVIGAPAYEARAAAITVYGQPGNHVVGDTAFQYHDHDFPQPGSTEGTAASPLSPGNGFIGGAILQTSGHSGVAEAYAQIFGAAGTFTQMLPDGTAIDLSLNANAIEARARSDCMASSTAVTIASLGYSVVVKAPDGQPVLNEFKGTQLTPSPNMVVADPYTNGGLVKVTLNYQIKTADPRRTDAAAIRIDIFGGSVDTPSGKAGTGTAIATIMIGHVTAGRLCAML